MTDPTLAPCPFCGNDLSVVIVRADNENDGAYVGCAKCEARGPSFRCKSPADTITAEWNTRAEDPRIAAMDRALALLGGRDRVSEHLADPANAARFDEEWRRDTAVMRAEERSGARIAALKRERDEAVQIAASALHDAETDGSHDGAADTAIAGLTAVVTHLNGTFPVVLPIIVLRRQRDELAALLLEGEDVPEDSVDNEDYCRRVEAALSRLGV